MFQLDEKSRKSIYEQIIDNMKELIITGILKQEEKLPSIRELSKILTVNPNTIQKAYRELERQGYVYTVSGSGCFVSPADNRIVDQARISELKETVRQMTMELFYLGISPEEILSFVSNIFRERSNEK